MAGKSWDKSECHHSGDPGRMAISFFPTKEQRQPRLFSIPAIDIPALISPILSGIFFQEIWNRFAGKTAIILIHNQSEDAFKQYAPYFETLKKLTYIPVYFKMKRSIPKPFKSFLERVSRELLSLAS